MHHHFAPPAWVSAVKGRPLLQPANTTWTPARSIEDMDRGGVAAAIVSITNPGLVVRRQADAESAGARVQRLRREARAGPSDPIRPVRRHAAARRRRHAGEIAYAYDTLKADGVGLFTSYGDIWLGNAAFRPVMEELNRRKAVVHVHPTAANCCRNLDYAPGVGPGSIEYGTDTTRAIMGVTFNGDAARFPDIRFIWSHAGGTAPFLAGRIDGASGNAKDRLPNGFIAEAGSSITISPAQPIAAPSRRCWNWSRPRRCCSAPISHLAERAQTRQGAGRDRSSSARPTCVRSIATTPLNFFRALGQS